MWMKLARWSAMLLGLGIIAVLLPMGSGLAKDLLDEKIPLKELQSNLIQQLFQPQYYKTYFNMDPIHAAAWALSLYVLYATIRFFIAGRFEKKETFEDRSEYGSHGSARWQSSEEIKSYYKSNKGIIVGDLSERIYKPGKQYATITLEEKENLNVIVFGPPGSQKTTGIVLPNMVNTGLNNGWSMVITDPKGELYEQQAPFLEAQGYEVRVLDFLHLKRGNRINFTDYVYEDEDLLRIADSYVTGGNIAKGSKGSSDPIWDDGEKSLLAALIGFVMQVYKDVPERQTFTEIANILNTEFNNDYYHLLFKRNDVTGTAEFLFNNFLLAKDKVRDGILFGLATKLTLFAIPGVQELTCRSEFSLEDLARKKIALFLLVSDADRTYSPLVTVLWSVLFNAVYKVRLLEKQSKVPILCLMDELANIGRIGGLQEKLGTMRSRHTYPVMIWQSLPQLKDRYPNNAWEDVISMCSTRVLLAANDDVTKKYFSEELGKTTVEIQGLSKNMKREDLIHNGESESSNYTGRPLMFPDEIGRMPKDSLILMEAGKNPAMFTKLQYRYWEKQYRVCEPTDYNEIPLLRKDEPQPEQEDELDLSWDDEVAATAEMETQEHSDFPKIEVKKSSSVFEVNIKGGTWEDD